MELRPKLKIAPDVNLENLSETFTLEQGTTLSSA